ncbi:MAG: acetyl-CoA carboxylase biotin carboxyl carrier protein [Oscillospiraceae bacterium]|nr:acetyl-CoA carboxylase biotin carboxyl carrier protein [Oscillospiraceae bacterium]
MNIEKFFSTENIGKLADLMEEKNLEEITMECDDEFKLTLKAKRPCPPPPMGGMAFAPAFDPMPATMNAAAKDAAPTVEAQNAVAGNVVKSPIVGTFYAAPSPDKAPFVTVGQQVKKGDVLMIIESMKLMNEIQSEFDGTVKDILVKNGEAVEFDQPIMIIA